MITTTAPLLALFLGLASASDAAAAGGDAPPPPNVVFILADDLGYTDLACYGSKYYETPNIDKMAARGVRFTDGTTCGPNCQPTRAALMSGQYGPRTGVYTVGNIDRFNWQSRPLRPVDNVVNLPLDKVTLAQALKRAGYDTALFGKWHLGQSGRHLPSARGFDEAVVSMGRHFDFETIPPTEQPPGTYLADYLTDRAVDYIARHKDRPFFLALHHFGVHSPFQAKKELIEGFKDKPPAGGHRDPTYAAMIRSVDESVGRVLKTLDDLKLSERTLVVFTSDNGGVGGYARAGVQREGGITDNAPLRGGKGMLYEGGVRVPYVFLWPGKIGPGRTCDRPINSVDLYPTLLELAGAKAPDDYPLDGVSYLGLLTGEGGGGRSEKEPLFWHFPGYLGAGQGGWRTKPAGSVRAGDWKLIEFFEDGRRELYHLRDDVGESNDLASKNPEKVRELHGLLAAWRAGIKAPMPTPHRPEPAGAPAKKKGAAKKKAATKKKAEAGADDPAS